MEKRVLVVDDEEAIGFALKRFLERYGMAVDVATDAAASRAHLANGPYDVVLADLRLTGTHDAEGLDLIEHVRQAHPATKCILLSAYANEELDRSARQRGADLVLRKPIGLPELRQHLQDLLAGSVAR